MIRKVLIFKLFAAALLGFFLLWPDKETLPELGNISEETLESIDGQRYSLHDPSIKLVVFFYSQCPDICPMTLFDLEQVKEELEKRQLFEEKVKFLNITLDPEVDTVQRLKEYAQSFGIDNERWLMLRTDLSTTEKVADEFNMVYKKESSGFVTHSTTMYLLDAENNIRAYHDMAVGDKRVNIDKIVEHIEILASE
ncbi:SCO family protein [Bacillus salacetis]|uniref:SCO family protein n=1 Tax=Bacillus salacetis TaxID=2315464 RepID=UPI003B9F7E9C